MFVESPDVERNVTAIRPMAAEARIRWHRVAIPAAILFALCGAWLQARILGLPGLTPLATLIPMVAGALAGGLIGWALNSRDLFRSATRTDNMTGLASRRAFEDALDAELARAIRYGNPFGVLMFDIDKFKAINDTHGHVAGDRAIRGVADACANVVRDTDLLARWGGDEFVLLCPSTGLPGARVLAEKLRRAVAESHPGVAVTVSLGLAQYVPGDDVSSIMTRADEALYRAKRAGRNCAATMRCLRPTQARLG